jgi:HK97 family phage portal protein
VAGERRQFLPALRSAVTNALVRPGSEIETKSLSSRVRSSIVSVVRPGIPYRDNWSVARAVREGYELNSLVYRCVDVICETGLKYPVVLRDGDRDTGKPVAISDDDTRLTYLLNRFANPRETALVFRHRLIAQHLLSKPGVFIEVLRTRSNAIGALNLADPDMVEFLPTENDPMAGFRIHTPASADGRPYDDLPRFDPNSDVDEQPASILWLRKPHPTVAWYGMSAIQACGITIDLDRYAKLYNRRFLQNDGRPGGLLSIKGKVSPELEERIQAQFEGGPESAGRTTVIAADSVSYADTSGSPRDTMWGDTIDRAKADVMGTFGVPQSIAWDSTGQTWDNADADFARFLGMKMQPLLNGIDDQLDQLTGAEDERWLRHDLSKEWVLNRHKRAEEDRYAADLERGTITIDEYREARGLPKLDVPATRVLWLPNNGKLAVALDDSTDAEVAAAAPLGGSAGQQAHDGGQPPALPGGGGGPPAIEGGPVEPRSGRERDVAGDRQALDDGTDFLGLEGKQSGGRPVGQYRPGHHSRAQHPADDPPAFPTGTTWR